ncbi:murein hydrolase activator EnvC family protein [Microbacterium yannicii]|uniref:murein hydrolase activator EnvC family protein n=1 Tax=Microbacterium yannicii TaxID=671622 RepID=UPI001ED998D5|nr:M23 family metallopeptidase [Microbacterium yannicii]
MRSRPAPVTARLRPASVAVMVAVVLACLFNPATSAAGDAAEPAARADASDTAPSGWTWPLPSFRLDRPFVAPPHAYGPGHRGIDLHAVGAQDVRAPAAGVVAFSGQVAGRGILTIDHGDGLVTTLEPVVSELAPGTAVEAAMPVGTIGFGGHAASGALHFGVRLHGEYINPMLMLGDVPRAVLLPCC